MLRHPFPIYIFCGVSLAAAKVPIKLRRSLDRIVEDFLHPARVEIEQLLTQCAIRNDRRSGPGGQHRNKVETAVVVEHLPSGMRGEGNERRSQVDNRRQAIQRLRLKLAVELRSGDNSEPEPAPSGLWQSRLRGKKLSVAQDHQDLPALLAEFLDYYVLAGLNLRAVADHFGTTTSQIVKLLRVHPPALRYVNDLRKQAGLRELQ